MKEVFVFQLWLVDDLKLLWILLWAFTIGLFLLYDAILWDGSGSQGSELVWLVDHALIPLFGPAVRIYVVVLLGRGAWIECGECSLIDRDCHYSRGSFPILRGSGLCASFSILRPSLHLISHCEKGVDLRVLCNSLIAQLKAMEHFSLIEERCQIYLHTACLFILAHRREHE